MKFIKYLLYITGILLVLSTGFQLLAMFGVLSVNDSIEKEYPFLITGWVLALSLLLIAFVFICVFKKKGKLPIFSLVFSLLGAFFALLVALTLKDAFPDKMGSEGATIGLTFWRLCYRHLSSILVGLLTAWACALSLRENRRRALRKEEAEYHSMFDLSGEPIFKDNSTLSLDYYAGEDGSASKPKRKRSLRAAEKKRKSAIAKVIAKAAEEKEE